jgi:competence ComEA-like helix-hairpin-helix protein
MGLKLHFVTLIIAGALGAAGQTLPDKLPEGTGKAVVKKVCTGCHEIGTVVGSRRTRIGWERNVDDMVSRGAEGSDEDMGAVVEYLTTFFGKTNVNTATAKDLQFALGFSDNEAQAIVALREQNGKFTDFEQMKKVPGIDLEKLQAKRPEIAFSL